jgi:hypothetical protein
MESIDTLNNRLVNHFGKDSSTGKPNFRIVWANDQLEKRLVSEVGGIQLLYPEVREVKKYPFWKDLYVLERLTVIPDENKHELPTQKLSYETIWAYRDKDNNPLPPIWDATKLIVDTVLAAMGRGNLRKYTDNEENTTKEGREHRIAKLHEELFGNETDTGDALRYKEGVTVPPNYEKVN